MPKRNAKQLRAEYLADLRELAQQDPKELQRLEQELKTEAAQLRAEYLADLRELAQQDPKELQRLEQEEKADADQLRAEIAADIAELAQGDPEELRKLEEQSREWPSEARYLGRVAAAPAPPQKMPTIKPTLIIARTPYPKWWKDLQTAEISLDDAGTEIIILPNPNFYLYIATIVLTVDGETDITFHFGVFGASGAMDFGGDGEPKGIVIAMGNSPTSCGVGSFQITSSEAGVHVGGFVSYYRESVKET